MSSLAELFLNHAYHETIRHTALPIHRAQTASLPMVFALPNHHRFPRFSINLSQSETGTDMVHYLV
jgi:hypothetical protein